MKSKWDKKYTVSFKTHVGRACVLTLEADDEEEAIRFTMGLRACAEIQSCKEIK